MGQASVNEFPAFRWFPMDSSAEPEVYEGPATAKALGNWVNQLMPNNVRVLQDARGMREWLESVAVVGIPAIVLFTDKRSAPPLWKSLGREFKNPNIVRHQLVYPISKCLCSGGAFINLWLSTTVHREPAERWEFVHRGLPH